jgi:hypothetical protein
MRKCEIEISDKTYILELNRNSIKWLEANGFVAEEFERKPLTFIDLLFTSGFVKNNPAITVNEGAMLLDKYESEGGDVQEIIDFLADEYKTFILALTDTKSKPKKKAKITEA